MKNKHIGSSLDEFLEQEGVKEEFEADAIARVERWKKALQSPAARKFLKQEHDRMRQKADKK